MSWDLVESRGVSGKRPVVFFVLFARRIHSFSYACYWLWNSVNADPCVWPHNVHRRYLASLLSSSLSSLPRRYKAYMLNLSLKG